MAQFADIFTGGYSTPGVRADFIAAPSETQEKSFDALTTADLPTTTEIASDSEKCMKADCDCGCDGKPKRPKLKSILQHSRELLQTTAKSLDEGGIWRTVEGDQKIFINNKGEVRAGSPTGPAIAKVSGAKKPAAKKPAAKNEAKNDEADKPKPKPKPKKPQANEAVKEWANERFKDPKKAANFQSWFGDSKAVDTDGKPLVVYHGTDKFVGDAFDVSKLGTATGADIAKAGFWFSSDKRVADSYADSAVYQQVAKIEMQIEEEPDKEKRKKLLQMAARKWQEIEDQKGEVLPVFLSLQKPKIIDMDSAEGKAKKLNQHVAEAVKAGHDGMIVRNLEDNPGGELYKADHYVIFNPLQVKSADQNDGTFDPTNASIKKSLARQKSAKMPKPKQTEQPDEMTEDDDAILDGIWDSIE